MIGRLIWNQDRPDIVFDTGTLYGGLHCGDCFACWLDGRWLDVRLEYMNDWVPDPQRSFCSSSLWRFCANLISPQPTYSSSSKTSLGSGGPAAR